MCAQLMETGKAEKERVVWKNLEIENFSLKAVPEVNE